MLCERCSAHPALERDQQSVRCYLFGEIEGYFCAECVRALQLPYEESLRRSVATEAPDLTEADLAEFPDQMLKFTLCLPIPAPGQE